MKDFWSSYSRGVMSRRRALASSTSLALGAALIAACGDGGAKSNAPLDKGGFLHTPVESNKPTPGGVLRDFQRADLLHLDPYTSSLGSVRLTAALAYPRLMKFVPAKFPKVADSSVEGDLVESYEFSGDKLQLTLKLRSGLKWDSRPPTNGRIIDAQDVISSWTRFGSVNTFAAPFLIYNSNNSPLAPVISIASPDGSTIVMKLHRPDGALLMGLAANDLFYVMPREADSQFDPKKEIRGHGPWQLEEWRPSAFVHWKRNPDYYVKGRPYYERLERPIVTEYVQQLAQFKAGHIHTSLVQRAEIIQTKRDVPETRLRQEEAFSAAAIGPFLRFGYEGDSPFKDVRVRQAASMSLDRPAFMDALDNLEAFRREGLEVPVAYQSVVTAGWQGFYLDPSREKEFGPSAKYLRHDVAEAKKLMSAAGFANGVDFDFHYNQDNNYGIPYARSRDLYTGMLSEVGLRPRMKGFPYTIYLDYHRSYIQRTFAGGETKGFNGILLTPPGESRVSIDQMLLGYFHKDGATFIGLTPDGRNAHLGDPKLNDAIDRMVVETDRKRQEALVHDFIRYFTEQAYAVPRPGISKGLVLTWPVIGNEGVWNTVGVPANAGVNPGPGNPEVESRLNWWYDASQPPAKA